MVPSAHNNMKRRRLTRLVSQDEFVMDAVCKVISSDFFKRAGSPVRCVSEFDQATPASASMKQSPLSTTLDNEISLKTHVAALRLEADLHPMRLVLARLMAHPTHNRKGLFNQPVDPVALGLADYHLLVTRPMDLGTVKIRLHAAAYQSRDHVVDDIHLVFTNAMRYNPPYNAVHKCAQELLAYFKEACQALSPCVSSTSAPAASSLDSEVVVFPLPAKTFSRMVSSMEEETLPGADSRTATVALCASGTSDATAPEANKPQSAGKCLKTTGEVCTSKEASASLIVAPLIHTHASNGLLPPPVASSTIVPKRKSRLPPFLPHTCQSCQGRNCAMCKQGCLFHEPALLVCQGVHCGGAKIRKGSGYFVTKDGHRHFCQRCYTNLPPVLPNSSETDACRYRVDLLKRKNDEEIAEDWITCSDCSVGVHAICAMHNGYIHSEANYRCLECLTSSDNSAMNFVPEELTDDNYTFVTGSDSPVPMYSLGAGLGGLSADALPECAVSSFIQTKVRGSMKIVPNADKTVSVRVISDCSRQFNVPEVVQRHFRMAAESDAVIKPPSQVRYRQKAITLFQKIDGLDVCIFCMYVQEYDGDDDYGSNQIDQVEPRHNKKVYIAYIDSVEHFRPRECRTEVYHEILVSYLATARVRGYETAQIWACPPSRGNSFVFWNHPSSQRTPSSERLVSWYHGALSRAIGFGIVTDVKSLFESEFEQSLSELEKEAAKTSQQGNTNIPCGRMVCPPLLDGDFWIEEAVRAHQTSISRNLKVRAPTEVCVWNVSPLTSEDLDPCPALQVATLVKDRIMTHPSSVPFRRPVNAAAMKLKNYHQIVTTPMDLGTIYSRCVIGEYHELREVVGDVKLMVANAKIFNPVGHFVHVKADEVLELFFQELSALTKIWDSTSEEESKSWESYADMSLSLDVTLNIPTTNTAVKTTSVVIEDDRSSDGSRSVASSPSVPSSPMSGVSSSKDEDSTQAQFPSVHRRILKMTSSSSTGPGRRGPEKPKAPPKKLDLLSDGPEAVMQCMVGDDYWLLDKRTPTPKAAGSKKAKGKRRRSLSSADMSVSIEDPAPKRRRQSWLGEEISETVRKMRTSFFACSLLPKKIMSDVEQTKLSGFQSYVDSFDFGINSNSSLSSPITDARHALLEFSQYRHFEFNTLRRAKYSTAMLLYHLQHPDAPGVVPVCTTCDQPIEELRWHKVKKVSEKRRVTKYMKPTTPFDHAFIREELCGCCHAKHSEKDEFIPIPVALKLVKPNEPM
jgi:hypothetical protein